MCNFLIYSDTSADLLYLEYIYLSIFSSDKKELEYNLDKIEGLLQSNGIQTRRANFRQEQLFLTCTPIMKNDLEIKRNRVYYVDNDFFENVFPANIQNSKYLCIKEIMLSMHQVELKRF